ncbi:RES domain-containing protein, partial [Vibrio cholerae]|nr:RES domain-containing protein [Vibrio cholerae]
MKMYRLTQKKFADTPFNPMGAKLFRGRWNSKGIEALYFAESESLCVLEVFVHINNDPELIHKYDLYRIDVPDELIVQLENEDLPNNWRAIPASEQTQEIGDQFL